MIWGIFESWAQVIEVAGVWLAAFATLVAAYVALHIANRSNRQTLKLNARPMLEITVGAGAPKPIFHVSATNLSLRPATITHLGAQSAFKYNSFIVVTGTPGSSPIPTTLHDGETAHWRFPETLPNGGSWYGDFALRMSKLTKLRRWLSLKTFRFLVVTSHGNTFYATPSAEFRKKVRDLMNVGKIP